MESQGPTRGAEGIAASRWRSRSWAARVVRGVTVLVPLGAGLVAARAVAPVLAHPRGLLGAVIFLAQVAVVSTTAATCTDRFTRRLLPLAALLRMSLVFPDEAPSRFKTALRAGSSKRLEADMRRARTQGLDGMPHADAAATLLEMLSTLGKHDRLTRGHTERVRAYSEMIAEEMQLSREDRDLLRWGVLIHDVGKLAVPGAILNKNGRPTDEEWEILKSHPAVGGRLVEPLAGWLGEWRLAASEHHERFDGKGYPRGLVGAEISLAGRIVAVADAYDVITSARSYKKAMAPEQARQELVRCAGSQFDPDVVRAMLNISLGKLRLAGGPLGVLADLPLLGNVPATAQLASSGGLTAISAFAATVLAVSAPVSGAQAAEPVPTPPAVVAFAEAATPTTLARGDAAPMAVAGMGTPTTTIGSSTAPAGSAVTPSGNGAATSSNGSSSPSTTSAGVGAARSAPTTTIAVGQGPVSAPTATMPTTTTAPVTSTTAPPFAAPHLQPDVATTATDGEVRASVLQNDTPYSGTLDPGTLTIVSGPAHAKDYGVHDDQLRYRPVKNFSGTDSITYRVCDTSGACGTTTLTITVTG